MAGGSVVFIHGRPGPHPSHAKDARSVGADFVPVDFLLRWHDVPARRWRRYVSWILCAFLFPNRGRYCVFLTEGPHFVPVIMRKLRLLRPEQKIFALMGNETLYFLREGRYSTRATRALVEALRAYDCLLCVGQMESTLARQLLGSACPPVYTTFLGPPAERQRTLQQVRPRLMSHKVLFIGHGPGQWRAWYKGLDLLLEAFQIAWQRDHRLRLTIVGEWSPEVVRALCSRNRFNDGSIVRFAGPSTDLAKHLRDAALYLHCGRGDAWGVSVMEAMCAGVVPVVSEWTGVQEVVRQVSGELVCPLDVDQIADRILWYFELPPARRLELSAGCRALMRRYTEENAVRHFAATFRRALRDLGLVPEPRGSDCAGPAGVEAHRPTVERR